MTVAKVSEFMEQAPYGLSSITSNVKTEKFDINKLAPTDMEPHQPTDENFSNFNYDIFPGIVVDARYEPSKNTALFAHILQNQENLNHNIYANQPSDPTSAVMLATHNAPTHGEAFDSQLDSSNEVFSEEELLNLEENAASHVGIAQKVFPNIQQNEKDPQTKDMFSTNILEPTSSNTGNSLSIQNQPNLKINHTEHRELDDTLEQDLPKELKNAIDENAKELSASNFQVRVNQKEATNNKILTKLNDEIKVASELSLTEQTFDNQSQEEGSTLKNEHIIDPSKDSKNEFLAEFKEDTKVEKSNAGKTQTLSHKTDESSFNNHSSAQSLFTSINEGGEQANEIARAVTSQTVQGIEKHFQANTSIKSLQIQLDPVHLGKVDIQISTLEDGSLHAKFTTENKETLQILARDSSQIEQVLKDSMLDNRNVQIDFASRQDGHHDGQQSQEKFDAHQANQMARIKNGYGFHQADGVHEYVRDTTLGYNIKA